MPCIARHSAGQPPGGWREHGRGDRGPLPTAPARKQVLGYLDPSAPRQPGCTLMHGPRMFAYSHGGPSALRGLLAPGSLVGTWAQPPTLLRPRIIWSLRPLQLFAYLKSRQPGTLYSTPWASCCLGLSPGLRLALCRPGSEQSPWLTSVSELSLMAKRT